MKVRKQSSTGDYQFGHGSQDIWSDVPDGPAQVAGTRLRLFVGDYFLDLTAGTPWTTQVLGKYTGQTRDMVIRTRILGTPGVKGITAYNSSLDRETRAFRVSATIDTLYGAAKLVEPI